MAARGSLLSWLRLSVLQRSRCRMHSVAGWAGLVLGLLLPRITLESTVANIRVTDALVAVGFGVLGAGDRYLLVAVPGRAMGL
jgi:hypothetical protein